MIIRPPSQEELNPKELGYRIKINESPFYFFPVTCSRRENHTPWAVAISHIFLSARRCRSELALHLALANHSLGSHHETILTWIRNHLFALPGSLSSVALSVLIVCWRFYLFFFKTFVITLCMKFSRVSVCFLFRDIFNLFRLAKIGR